MKMIKYFIAFLAALIISAPVSADVMPYYKMAISKKTMGFVQLPNTFNLYELPRDDSAIVDTLSWNRVEVKLRKHSLEPADSFVVFINDKKLAYFTVIDEDEGGWYQIIYDKRSNKAAWVKANEEDFWGLKDFITFYGKKYGLTYMRDVDYRKRGLYSGADSASQKLQGFTFIENIKLNKISGNWGLVTVVDFNSLPKIGYIQWREQDGTIILFPRFDLPE